MSLASRLTALVQAIGADVKKLNEVSMLKPVDAASTGNVDITSAPPTTEFDGVTGASWLTGRLLLHKQTNPAENGIWLYNAQGAPLLRADDVLKIKAGQTVYVRVGKTYGGKMFVSKSNAALGESWGFAPIPYAAESIAEPCMKAYTAQQSLTGIILDASFDGDRVLLTGQTDKSENGVYVYDANTETLVRVAGEVYTPGRLFPLVTQSTLDLDTDWTTPEIWACTEIGGSEGYTFAKIGGGGTSFNTAEIGSIMAWSRKTMPWEYVLANGQRLTRADYPQGYDCAVEEVAAGNPEWTYRTSDETFTVPNLSDRFILAPGAVRLLGARGGFENVLLTARQSGLRAHTHGPIITRDTLGNGSATNAIARSGPTGTTNNATGGMVDPVDQAALDTHDNMPPYVVLAQLVKVRGVVMADATVIQGPPGPAGANGASSGFSDSFATDTKANYDGGTSAALSVASGALLNSGAAPLEISPKSVLASPSLVLGAKVTLAGAHEFRVSIKQDRDTANILAFIRQTDRNTVIQDTRVGRATAFLGSSGLVGLAPAAGQTRWLRVYVYGNTVRMEVWTVDPDTNPAAAEEAAASGTLPFWWLGNLGRCRPFFWITAGGTLDDLFLR